MLYFIILIVLFSASIMAISKDTSGGFTMLCISLTIALPWLGSYSNHAYDLALISDQYRIVSVYEKRIVSLAKRLETISNGKITTALLNADTPVASLVKSITSLELKIADAEEVQAQAFVNIAQRKLGFYKSATWLFNEKENIK